MLDPVAARLYLIVKGFKDDRGASLVEYALLVALIAIVCIGGVTLLGRSTNSNISGAATSI